MKHTHTTLTFYTLNVYLCVNAKCTQSHVYNFHSVESQKSCEIDACRYLFTTILICYLWYFSSVSQFFVYPHCDLNWLLLDFILIIHILCCAVLPQSKTPFSHDNDVFDLTLCYVTLYECITWYSTRSLCCYLINEWFNDTVFQI